MMLASLLALLSYVPFEYVAKASLVLCVALFVLDPVPPVTRLVALMSTVVVSYLSKRYQQWKEEEQEQEEERNLVDTDDAGDTDSDEVEKKDK